jgi:hypothetical protein
MVRKTSVAIETEKLKALQSKNKVKYTKVKTKTKISKPAVIDNVIGPKNKETIVKAIVNKEKTIKENISKVKANSKSVNKSKDIVTERKPKTLEKSEEEIKDAEIEDIIVKYEKLHKTDAVVTEDKDKK